VPELVTNLKKRIESLFQVDHGYAETAKNLKKRIERCSRNTRPA